MAHEVKMILNTSVVLNKDVKFEVKTSEGKLGDLLISKGNIEWVPTNNSVNKHRLSWKKFANLIEEHGKPAKIKS